MPEIDVTQRLEIGIANGRHRLWAARVADDGGPAPIADGRLSTLYALVETADDQGWTFHDEKREEWANYLRDWLAKALPTLIDLNTDYIATLTAIPRLDAALRFIDAD
ncbi:hypothetical protein MU582_06840 [Nocardioidaceae bacterium SCSIO 66511]|nr:hypothetical protein MU582_06840 [Nocardioidaceae bacterium SCSIO 66511]